MRSHFAGVGFIDVTINVRQISKLILSNVILIFECIKVALSEPKQKKMTRIKGILKLGFQIRYTYIRRIA